MDKTLQKIIDLTEEGKLTWTTGILPQFSQTGDYKLVLMEDSSGLTLYSHANANVVYKSRDQDNLADLVKLVNPNPLGDFMEHLDSLGDTWMPVTEDMSSMNLSGIDDILEVRLTTSKVLTEQELDLAVGAVGYAATEHLRGETGVITDSKGGVTITYDLTKSRRSEVAGAVRDFLEASLSYLTEGKYHKGSGTMLGLDDPSVLSAYEVKTG